MYLKCMFQPGLKCFICAPRISQGAKIAKEKIYEIWDLFPILKKEILVVNGHFGAFGTDNVRLPFRNGSVFDVVGALNSTRGGRRNA